MFTRRTARTIATASSALAMMATGAAMAGAATVPPSDKVFIREMTWSCGDLGDFQASYNVMGQDPALMWLSRDGSREDAVMVTFINGQITLGDGDPMGPSPRQPQRAGMDQYTCSLDYTSPDFSISGWALVGVVRGRSGTA